MNLQFIGFVKAQCRSANHMLEVPDPPLELAWTPTQVEQLEGLSAGGDLYIKRDDTTAGPAQGNKIRKLEYELGSALEADADVVVTGGGIQSNHCRATALLASRLGLETHLVLLGDPPRDPGGNYLLSTLVADRTQTLPESEFSGWEHALDAAATQERALERNPYVVPIGASTPRGALGYVRAYGEIAAWMRDCGVEPDRIVVPTGSAGTQAGLLAASLADDGPAVTGIDVTPYGRRYQEETVQELVEGIYRQLETNAPAPGTIEAAVDVRSGYVGPGYASPAEADLETIATVARQSGIVLDPTYTGKAFRACLDMVDAGEECLFVHTGGSYGLFPHSTAVHEAAERMSDRTEDPS